MSGPFNPDADPQIWAPGLKGNQGTIPMRWIVAKDVQFSVFNDLKYKGQCVTQLRHANTYVLFHPTAWSVKLTKTSSSECPVKLAVFLYNYTSKPSTRIQQSLTQRKIPLSHHPGPSRSLRSQRHA